MTRTATKIIPYARPYIDEQDIESVVLSLKGDSLTRGPWVEKFEQAIATYCDVKYAVCFNTGTTALQAAYYALETGPQDLVITTPNTFAATIVGALQSGSQVICVDIERNTGNLSLTEARQVLQSFPGRKIFVPVHFSGIPVDFIDAFSNDVWIVEDAAHALGAVDKSGSRIGSCRSSHMTVLSFHPAKSITTGEGGMVTTNDPTLYQRLCAYRNNGIVRNLPHPDYPGYYEIHSLTGNYNFTDFQAALGLSQLSKLDLFIDGRKKLVKIYRHRLQNIPEIHLFDEKTDPFSAHHLLVVQIDFKKLGKNRCQIMEDLKKEGIQTQVHYIPLDRHPAIASKIKSHPTPQMQLYFEQALTLPLYYGLTEEEVHRICDSLIDLLEV